MTIRLPMQYSIDRARNWIRGSLQAHGEQCILLSTYHPTRDKDRIRCPNCTDDIYTGGSNNCPICYGTGFFGGVRTATRVWALFSDTRRPEKYSERGVWAADRREIQTEAFPELIEHDYVARVKEWDVTGEIPQDLEGFYGIGEVTQDSLRTGGRAGQYRWDVVGQRAPISKLARNIKIGDFPIVGQSFPAFRWSSITNPPMPVQSAPPWLTGRART